MENLTIKKLHKTYGKRKIQVYHGKKLFGELGECWGWLYLDPKMKDRQGKEFEEKFNILRKIAMENLWWILHTDNINEDYTEYEAWEEKINRWDKGRIMGNSDETSLFLSKEEKKIALNSINNKL